MCGCCLGVLRDDDVAQYVDSYPVVDGMSRQPAAHRHCACMYHADVSHVLFAIYRAKVMMCTAIMMFAP